MFEKAKTALWFARRPTHWAHGTALIRRKFLTDYDDPTSRARARKWAAERVVSLASALSTIGLSGQLAQMDPKLMAEGEELACRSSVRMGGAGDLDLLYNAFRLARPLRVLETGVAYGWSSLAILSAFDDRDDTKLVSVDMPYPKMNNEAFVGIVVPRRFYGKWQLIREPDRHGIEKAIDMLGGTIDACHYDSDKSWWGRQYAYPRLWAALRPGGLFISDDIQDNMAFAEFVQAKAVPFAITESQNKFVGIAVKKT